jgi:hypothetical protein
MDLQSWSAFQDFEVDVSQYPFDGVQTEDNEKVIVDMGSKKEIELIFSPVNAKGIKIEVLDAAHVYGSVGFYEVLVYEQNCGTTNFLFALY